MTKKNGKSLTLNLHILLYLYLIGILLPFQETTGQQKVVYTLQQTVSLAADSSIQALNAKYKFLQSRWQYQTFKVYHLPQITLQTNPIAYNRVFIKRYDSENNIDIYRQQQSWSSYGNLSIQQNMGLTGGQFFIDTEFGYLRNFGSGSPYTQFSSVPFRIGYSQNLFGFNSYKWDKMIEPITFNKAQKELSYAIAFAEETASGYFFDLATSQISYELAKQNLENTDTLYKIGMERFNLGSLSKGDLLSLKLQALNSKATLEKAKLDLKRSKTAFCEYLRIDLEKESIKVELPVEIKQYDIPVELAVQKTLENNPTITELQENVLSAQRNLEKAKISNRFSADISASLGFNQVANTFIGAYTHPTQQNMLTVNLKIPILDWGIGKGKIIVATENLKTVKVSNEQTEKSLLKDVEISVNELNLNRINISTSTEAKIVADEAYKTTKELFILGKADVNSVNLAVSGQMEAQISYVQALRSYWSSYYKLKRLTLWEFDKAK